MWGKFARKMYLPVGVKFVCDVERKHPVSTPLSEII